MRLSHDQTTLIGGGTIFVENFSCGE